MQNEWTQDWSNISEIAGGEKSLYLGLILKNETVMKTYTLWLQLCVKFLELKNESSVGTLFLHNFSLKIAVQQGTISFML